MEFNPFKFNSYSFFNDFTLCCTNLFSETQIWVNPSHKIQCYISYQTEVFMLPLAWPYFFSRNDVRSFIRVNNLTPRIMEEGNFHSSQVYHHYGILGIPYLVWNTYMVTAYTWYCLACSNSTYIPAVFVKSLDTNILIPYPPTCQFLFY